MLNHEMFNAIGDILRNNTDHIDKISEDYSISFQYVCLSGPHNQKLIWSERERDIQGNDCIHGFDIDYVSENNDNNHIKLFITQISTYASNSIVLHPREENPLRISQKLFSIYSLLSSTV